jgi:pre-mRNA-splicing factor ISY1
MPPSEDVKRVKGDSPSEAEQTLIHVRAAASYIPFLTPEILLPPKLPTHDEMEAILLALRKKALVEEYFGGGESKDDIVVG